MYMSVWINDVAFIKLILHVLTSTSFLSFSKYIKWTNEWLHNPFHFTYTCTQSILDKLQNNVTLSSHWKTIRIFSSNASRLPQNAFYQLEAEYLGTHFLWKVRFSHQHKYQFHQARLKEQLLLYVIHRYIDGHHCVLWVHRTMQCCSRW